MVCPHFSGTGWLAPGALAVIEQAEREPFAPPVAFAAADERRDGRTRLVFLRYEG